MERRMFLGAVVVLSALLAALLSSRGTQLGGQLGELGDSSEHRWTIEQQRFDIETARSVDEHATVAESYTLDARFFPLADEPVVGRAAIASYYRAAPGFTHYPGSLEFQGDMALERGGLDANGGSYLVVWKYSDSEWKIMLDVESVGSR